MKKLSENGRRFIEVHEGLSLDAYQDGAGIWTIGYGHTKGVHEGMSCSSLQADEWLSEDVAPCEQAVNADVKVALTQNQFDALCSFCFNLGTASLASSTLLKDLNMGQYLAAADQFLRWVHDANGNIEPGLVKRRQDERALFLETA